MGEGGLFVAWMRQSRNPKDWIPQQHRRTSTGKSSLAITARKSVKSWSLARVEGREGMSYGHHSPCSGKMGIGGTVGLEVVVVLGVVRVKEVVESDVPLVLSVFGELVVIPGNIGKENKSGFYVTENEELGETAEMSAYIVVNSQRLHVYANRTDGVEGLLVIRCGGLTSADSPEEDVPWEGVFVTVGPGEEDEWFSVVGFVRMLV